MLYHFRTRKIRIVHVLENEQFRNLGNIITNDGKYTKKIKARVTTAKVILGKKKKQLMECLAKKKVAEELSRV